MENGCLGYASNPNEFTLRGCGGGEAERKDEINIGWVVRLVIPCDPHKTKRLQRPAIASMHMSSPR